MIAVTGAGGRLGQWVMAHLAAAGRDVLAVSRSPRSRPTIRGLSWDRPVRTLACDLTDPGAVPILEKGLVGVEAVVHLAGHVPDDTWRNSDEDARATFETNILGTIRLLQALEEVRTLRSLVYTSTFEVYGPPRMRPIPESHPTEPWGYYGASKLAAEKYAALFSEGRGISCCSLRLPAVYGPGDTIRRAIGNFARAAAEGTEIVIHGDGEDRRELLYVADAARGIDLALEKGLGVINLGSGSGFSVTQMAEAALRVAAEGCRVRREVGLKPRMDYVLSIERAGRVLGWRPEVSLEEGMARQVEWCRGEEKGR